MIRLKPFILAALIALTGISQGFAQSTVLQGGPWTPGHVPMYAGQGSSTPVVIDGGPAGGAALGNTASELALTQRSPTGTYPAVGAGTGPLGTNLCLFDAPITNATGYHFLCFGAQGTSNAGVIDFGAGGAASTIPLNFVVNGATYPFPFAVGGIVGPGTTVVNDAACWNNVVGTLLKDCGAFVTVGGNNTWTGTNNYTGTFQVNGAAETFPASGNIVGTSDAQSLTNKSIAASEINSGTLAGAQAFALTGDVTSSAGSPVTAIAANAVTNAKLATATQNTVKGAATSTAEADLAVPSCSSAGNALQWTTSTGFGCGTLTNQTAGWGLTGSSTFSISTSQPPYGYDVPINLGLTPSVGASALTINLTGANGSAPSATNPVCVPFRSTTLTAGTPTWACLTAATSITVNSAATLGTSNGVPFKIWIFLEYNGGSPELAVAVCSTSTTIYPCAAWEYTRITSTTITGLATSAGTLYAATAGVSNDSVRMIGYAEYGAGLATAGSYASIPTTLQLFGPGIKKPGDVVQTVFTSTGNRVDGATTYTISNTAPTTSTTNSAINLPMTPTATSNLVRVNAQAIVGSTSSLGTAVAILTNSNAGGTTALVTSAVQHGNPSVGATSLPLYYQTIAGTPIATQTYYIYFADSVGSSAFNGINGTSEFGATGNSFIRIEEIMGALEPANDNMPLRMTG